jgi:hypothetical protein
MKLLVLTAKEFKSAQFFIPSVMEAMLVVVGERLRRTDEGWTRDVAVATRFDPQLSVPLTTFSDESRDSDGNNQPLGLRGDRQDAGATSH